MAPGWDFWCDSESERDTTNMAEVHEKWKEQGHHDRLEVWERCPKVFSRLVRCELGIVNVLGWKPEVVITLREPYWR